MINFVACPMDEDKFQNHMKNKAESWEATICHIGKDFAVFTFGYVYKVREIIHNLKQYASYYGYRFHSFDNKVVIINTKT